MVACSSSMPRVDALNALTHDRPTACSVPDAMMLNRDCNDPATLVGRARSSVGCETSVLSPAIIIVITNFTTASTLAVARGRLLIPLRYRYTWSLEFPPSHGSRVDLGLHVRGIQAWHIIEPPASPLVSDTRQTRLPSTAQRPQPLESWWCAQTESPREATAHYRSARV
jgi:hypothetical protein